MKPGRIVASPRSITSAPAGTAPPTSAIFPSSTTTTAGETSRSDRPSNIRAAFNTIVFGALFGGAWARAASAPRNVAARKRDRFIGGSPYAPASLHGPHPGRRDAGHPSPVGEGVGEYPD